jgi:hypothetical protein
MDVEQTSKPVDFKPQPLDPSSSPALRRLIEEVRIESESGSGSLGMDRSHNRYDRQHNRHNR